MLRIYTADSLIEGQLLVDLLIESDIEAEMFHQNSMGGLGELPVTYPEVWIHNNQHRGRANQLVAEFVNRQPPENDSPCGNCGESNPDNFDVCWLCNSVLSAQAVDPA